MSSETKEKAKEFAFKYFLKHKDWPTYDAIRAHLNYHGSYQTIKKGIEAAQNEVYKHVNVADRFPEIPEELVLLLLNVYQKSVQSASQLFDQERTALSEEARLQGVEIESLKQENLLLNNHSTALQQELSDCQFRIQAQDEHIQNIEKSLEYLEVEVVNQQNLQNQLRNEIEIQQKQAEEKSFELKNHYEEKLRIADKRNDDNEIRLVARIAEEQVRREKEVKEAKAEINSLSSQNTDKSVKIGVLENDCLNLKSTNRHLEAQLNEIKQQCHDHQATIHHLKDEHLDYKTQTKENLENLKSLLKSKEDLEIELRLRLDELKKEIQELQKKSKNKTTSQ